MAENEKITKRPGIETTTSYKNSVEYSRLAGDNLETLAQNLWNLAYDRRGPMINEYLRLSERMQKIGKEVADLHMKFLKGEMP